MVQYINQKTNLEKTQDEINIVSRMMSALAFIPQYSKDKYVQTEN